MCMPSTGKQFQGTEHIALLNINSFCYATHRVQCNLLLNAQSNQTLEFENLVLMCAIRLQLASLPM